MKAVILDGSSKGDSFAINVRNALIADLQARAYSVQCLVLGEMQISYCLGDFKCWTRTPGICAIDDDNRVVAKAVAQSDVIFFLTPVTFGGYSSTLKKALDHLIQDISPFFTRVNGETHHPKRYSNFPTIVAVGLLSEQDEESEQIFASLVERNALNWQSSSGTVFVYRNQPLPTHQVWMEAGIL